MAFFEPCGFLRAAIGAIVVAAACAPSTLGQPDSRAAERAGYRPGQSINTARHCECRECAVLSCCSGDPDDVEPASDKELGVTVASCGRCTRRVWTVSGDQSCDFRAPEGCCPDSIRP